MIRVNGTLLQHHQVRGPVGYTIAGSPTIQNGIASGFSTNNFLMLTQVPQFLNSYEIVADFTSGPAWANSLGGSCTVLGQLYHNIHSPQISIAAQDHKLYFGHPNANHTWNSISIAAQLNTHYLVKMEWDGQTFAAYLKNANVWELVERVAAPDIGWDEGIIWGTDDGRHSFWNGQINLNHTYIKVNGKLWFYHPQETKKIRVNHTLVWEKEV